MDNIWTQKLGKCFSVLNQAWVSASVLWDLTWVQWMASPISSAHLSHTVLGLHVRQQNVVLIKKQIKGIRTCDCPKNIL
jgi:hypothetical protein